MLRLDSSPLQVSLSLHLHRSMCSSRPGTRHCDYVKSAVWDNDEFEAGVHGEPGEGLIGVMDEVSIVHAL